jgi:RimJ/RimL family protein N-acetyltransferase
MLIEFRENEYFWKLSEQTRDNMGSFYLKRLKRNQFCDKPVVELWSFGIYGPHRGKGYGKQMLKEAINLAGDNVMMLYVEHDNKIAINLYKKSGFEIVGDFGKFAWAMVYCGNEAGQNLVTSTKRSNAA